MGFGLDRIGLEWGRIGRDWMVWCGGGEGGREGGIYRRLFTFVPSLFLFLSDFNDVQVDFFLTSGRLIISPFFSSSTFQFFFFHLSLLTISTFLVSYFCSFFIRINFCFILFPFVLLYFVLLNPDMFFFPLFYLILSYPPPSFPRSII